MSQKTSLFDLCEERDLVELRRHHRGRATLVHGACLVMLPPDARAAPGKVGSPVRVPALHDGRDKVVCKTPRHSV